jgi:hypothetical protein
VKSRRQRRTKKRQGNNPAAADKVMADVNRRELILLAEASECALSATRVLTGLVIHLHRLEALRKSGKVLPTDDPFYKPILITKGCVTNLFEIRILLSQLISEMP